MLDFIPLGLLAGIGFTVSLLIAHLAFIDDRELYAQATLGVLLGSFVAMSLGGAALWFRGRWYLSNNKKKRKAKPAQSKTRSAK